MPPKKGKPTKGKIPPQLEDWMMVVEDVKAKNPNLKYTEVLAKARPKYIELKKKLGL